MPDVTMPQLGETVTEGTITRWMKSVGDSVVRDEPLFEVSTDKVDSEVPAPADGVLTEILVQEGETVEVGVRLAVISGVEAGGSSSAPPPSVESPAPPAPPPPPPAGFTPTPVVQAHQDVPAQPRIAPPAPVVPPYVPPAPQAPPTPAEPVSTPVIQGASQQSSMATTEVGNASPPASSFSTLDDSRILSPVVRRLLAENSIDPSQITGTGLGGRITREDVLSIIDARVPTSPPLGPLGAEGAGVTESVNQTINQAGNGAVELPSLTGNTAQMPPQPQPQPQPPLLPASTMPPAVSMATFRQAGERVVPFSNMRRRTAEHMLRSKATSPHAFIAYEVDFENVERIRNQWGQRFRAEEGFSLTYLPFIARAAVEALRDFPNLNASVVDDSLVIHSDINLGIAVDLQHEGLIVPVIHRAEEITLRGIARRIRDLAERARSRQLNADDIASGTFSITNDGPFGTYFTVPIINQPQVAILATDGIKRRPVVIRLPDGTESIAIHSVGIIGMSWDHRAIDGAYVSSFLARVSELIATRDWGGEL